ncbi:erythromycin esterase family protein, partial [Lysobacter sp. A3-1-A15]
RAFHDAGHPACLVDLREGRHPELREALLEPRLERFIGVIYLPDTERWSHYAHATLAQQFDAYVWFDRTRAVEPLDDGDAAGEGEGEGEGESMPDTWPFGL